MRKIFSKLMVINFVTVLLFSGQALAQGVDPNNYGQNQAYQVLLRANGESIVNLSVDYTNTSGKVINEVVFKAPNAKISAIKAWQFTQYSKCYEQVSNREVPISLCDQNSQIHNSIVAPITFGGGIATSVRGVTYENPDSDKYYFEYTNYGASSVTSTQCFSRAGDVQVDRSFCESQQNDYLVYIYPYLWRQHKGYYFVKGPAMQWQEVNAKYTGDELKIVLANTVPQNNKVSLSVRYRASGYVTKGLFGSKNFSFKTLESADEIKTANVTVTADADLFFKGKKSNIGSGVMDQMMSAPKMTGAGLSEASGNLGMAYTSSYDTYGYYRRDTGAAASFYRSAQYLAAGETLTVNGTYATSWFGYYYKNILLALFVLAAIIVSVLFLKKWYRKWQEKHGMILQQQDGPVKNSSTGLIRSNLVWGLISASAFMGGLITIFTVYDKMPHTYRYADGPLAIMYPISILISFLVSVGLFLGGPLYIGTKRENRAQGLIVFGYEILFLFVANIIYFYFSNY